MPRFVNINYEIGYWLVVPFGLDLPLGFVLLGAACLGIFLPEAQPPFIILPAMEVSYLWHGSGMSCPRNVTSSPRTCMRYSFFVKGP